MSSRVDVLVGMGSGIVETQDMVHAIKIMLVIFGVAITQTVVMANIILVKIEIHILGAIVGMMAVVDMLVNI
jgi:hypothetical protein